MIRKIFCTYLKKYEEGLEHQPYPGNIGKKIYNEISKSAWKKWMKKQTIIINEQKLNMINIKDRNKLEKYMKIFLFESNKSTLKE